MKKSVYFIVFSVLLSFNLMAQNTFDFGVKLQSDINKVAVEKGDGTLGSSLSYNPRLSAGYAVGIFGEYNTTGLFIRLGVDYEVSKYKHSLDGLIFSSDIEIPTGPVTNSTITGTTSSVIDTRSISTIGFPLTIGHKFNIGEGYSNIILGTSIIPNLIIKPVSKQLIDYGTLPDQEISKEEVGGDFVRLPIEIFALYDFSIGDSFRIGIGPNAKFGKNKFDLYSSYGDMTSYYEFGLRLEVKSDR